MSSPATVAIQYFTRGVVCLDRGGTSGSSLGTSSYTYNGQLKLYILVRVCVSSFETSIPDFGQHNFAKVTQQTLGMILRFQYFEVFKYVILLLLGGTCSRC